MLSSKSIISKNFKCFQKFFLHLTAGVWQFDFDLVCDYKLRHTLEVTPSLVCKTITCSFSFLHLIQDI